MSDLNLGELYELVFRDIRITNNEKIYRKKTKEALALFDSYIDKVKIYRCVVGEIFAAYPDAERWENDFYLHNYKCFEKGYKHKDDYLWYVENGKEVKITADILTGPIYIIRFAEKLESAARKQDLKNALELFCSVAYTVGNSCPVMKNPSAGGDFCWSKLASFHNVDERKKIPGILDAEWDNNLRKRDAMNMFAVFPENLSGRVIIKNLMLNDYYDPDYKLKMNYSLEDCKKMDVDAYIEFLNRITLLIVKRGIRIYCKNDLRGINIDKLAEKLIQKKISREHWEMEFDCKYLR